MHAGLVRGSIKSFKSEEEGQEKKKSVSEWMCELERVNIGGN